MAILARRGSVSSPTGVSNARVGLEGFGQVWFAFRNELLQFRNLSHLLVSGNFFLLVAIDGQTRRVVTPVFKSGKSCKMRGGAKSDHMQNTQARRKQSQLPTIEESIQDEFTVSLDQVVDVAKDTTALG